jgi:hypothetical protein
MDRPVQIGVALIAKIIGLPTISARPDEYLDNKAREKEIAEQVKVQFSTTRGNRGIIIKDINDNGTRFTSNFMACKLLRKCPLRGSANKRHCSSCAVREGGYVQLGTIPIEPVLNRLSRHAG